MTLTPEELERYKERGYLIVRGLFSADEVTRVLGEAERDQELLSHTFDREDGEGGRVRMALWNHPGDDVYLSLIHI